MKCDLCNKAAVVHEVIIQGGKSTELHLCAEHAIEKGLPVPMQQPLADILPALGGVVKVEGAIGKGQQQARCPACGLTFSEFKKSGSLGCPACYDSFMPMIAQVIERAQAGATAHVGHSPAPSHDAERVQRQRSKLMTDLEQAIAAEQYERAAQLRDELKALDAAPQVRDE
jgi:protein arginine kinase activator